MLALLRIEVCDTLDSQIIGFSGTRSPYDFSRVRVDQLRDVIARIVDGSRFHEFKPSFGTSIVCGFGSMYGLFFWKP